MILFKHYLPYSTEDFHTPATHWYTESDPFMTIDPSKLDPFMTISST